MLVMGVTLSNFVLQFLWGRIFENIGWETNSNHREDLHSRSSFYFICVFLFFLLEWNSTKKLTTNQGQIIVGMIKNEK